ncbi:MULTISPECIES: hypothetical protein [Amycolatopsis]|uniref:Uncharacterized protein n=1 Tax=Amycolatopsis albidoflavus TaxID=102226 RepID=A0ABW5HTL2_9PSEU
MSQPPTEEAADALSAEELLACAGEVFINFQDRSYRWVSIKLFALPPIPVDDRTVLRLLLRHGRYRDDYAGGGDNLTALVHARYRLDLITLDSFTPADPTVEEQVLRTWAEQYDRLPAAVQAQMERELYPRLHSATSLYRLADLDENAYHEYGSVVGFSGFHELVLIDRDTGALALAVASDD